MPPLRCCCLPSLVSSSTSKSAEYPAACEVAIKAGWCQDQDRGANLHVLLGYVRWRECVLRPAGTSAQRRCEAPGLDDVGLTVHSGLWDG